MSREPEKKRKKKNKSQEFQLILSIPIDLIKIIRDYLDQRDLFNFYCTCKIFNSTNDKVFQERFIRWRIDSGVMEKLLMCDTSSTERLEKMKRIYGKFGNFWWTFEGVHSIYGFYHKDRIDIVLQMSIYGNRPEENSFRYRYESPIYVGFEIKFYSYSEVLAAYEQTEAFRSTSKSWVDFKFLVRGKEKELCKLITVQHICDIHQFRTIREYHKHVRKCLEIDSLTNARLATFMEELPIEQIFGYM